ncbi:uncharacterized protein [Malus domestica]|uniref:uncharacterized protein n=1 Tax=Malus domestica TaxID=3750 RepID=UPI0039757AE5
MDELQRHLETDTWVLKKKELVVGKEFDALPLVTYKFQFDNGFLKYKGRIVLSPTSSWRDKIFTELHSSPLAGHEGFLKTYKRITRSFYWEWMKKDIKDKVTSCSVCQKHLGPQVQATVSLPVITEVGILQDVSVAILDQRMVKRGNAAVTEILVQWQNHSKDDATWEIYHDLKMKFPEIENL